jgi:hypothetical protein
MIGTNQPDLVVAILAELDRQQPGILCNPPLFALICRAADEIVAAARQAEVGPATALPDQQAAE